MIHAKGRTNRVKIKTILHSEHVPNHPPESVNGLGPLLGEDVVQRKPLFNQDWFFIAVRAIEYTSRLKQAEVQLYPIVYIVLKINHSSGFRPMNLASLYPSSSSK